MTHIACFILFNFAPMIHKIASYINKNKLFEKSNRLLLAVSGGGDSMALLNIILKLGYDCEVAHVNFQLRGDDSDADTALVEKVCAEHKLILHVKTVDTMAYAREHKQSMEMAAREIRYDFFAELMKERKLDYLVVAHHRNDVVETFFINLMRGTGLRGLSGIKAKTGNIVRPLLGISRADVENYLEENNLEYRTDKSNFDTEIKRNQIRHVMIPDFEAQKPGFTDIMQRTIERLRESELLANAYVQDWKLANVKQEGDVVFIDKSALYNSVSPSEILFQILNPLGFSVSIIDELVAKSDWRVGAFFESESYRLTIDRTHFIIDKKGENKSEYFIEKVEQFISIPIKMDFVFLKNNSDFKLEKRADIAFLDADKLTFPLVLRLWKNSDVFCPIGMKGKSKKLSDFFIDNKFSQNQKENTWLLCSGDDIVWVVGYRLDERYKVTDKTQSILMIAL